MRLTLVLCALVIFAGFTLWRALEPSVIVRDGAPDVIQCTEQHKYPAALLCVPGVYTTSIHGKTFRVVVTEVQ